MKPAIIIHSDVRLFRVIIQLCQEQRYHLILYGDKGGISDQLDKLGLPYKQFDEWCSESVETRVECAKNQVITQNLSSLNYSGLWKPFHPIITDQSPEQDEIKSFLNKFLFQEIVLIEIFAEIIRSYQILSVVLLDDWPNYFQTLARIAKSYNIPVLTIVHGILSGEPGRKYLADKYAVFGERDIGYLSNLKDYGTSRYLLSEDQMVITGNPAWDKYSELRLLPRGDMLSENDSGTIDPQKPIVVFLSSYGRDLVSVEHIIKILATFLEATKKISEKNGLQVVIKVHPYGSLTVDWHRTICQESGVPNALVIKDGLEKWLNACNFVVSPGFSSSLIEAALCGKPGVLMIDMEMEKSDNRLKMQGISQRDCITPCNISVEAIEGILSQLTEGGVLKNKLVDNISYTIKRFAHKNDGQSFNRVIDFIHSAIQEKDNRTVYNKRLHEIHFIIIQPNIDQQLLSDTINSLGNQNASAWRLSVISTIPSPDPMFESLDMLNWIQSDDPTALNNLIDDTDSGIIGMLQAGDQLEPQTVKLILNTFSRSAETQLLYTNEDLFNAEGEILSTLEKGSYEQMCQKSSFGNGIFLRCKIFFEIDKIHEVFYESNTLIEKIAYQYGQDSISYVPEVLYHTAIKQCR